MFLIQEFPELGLHKISFNKDRKGAIERWMESMSAVYAAGNFQKTKCKFLHKKENWLSKKFLNFHSPHPGIKPLTVDVYI